MREVKFRAWDEKRKTMMQPIYSGKIPTAKKKDFFIGFNSTGLEVSEYEEKGRWRRFPIMQFAGRTDINNKDIYEDDIVKRYWGDRDGEFSVGVVRWDEGLLSFEVRTIDDEEMCSLLPHYKFEVIGNTHESPELLKEAQ